MMEKHFYILKIIKVSLLLCFVIGCQSEIEYTLVNGTYATHVQTIKSDSIDSITVFGLGVDTLILNDDKTYKLILNGQIVLLGEFQRNVNQLLLAPGIMITKHDNDTTFYTKKDRNSINRTYTICADNTLYYNSLSCDSLYSLSNTMSLVK